MVLPLTLCSTSHGLINKKCVHPGVRDVIRNECAEFMLTAGTDTYGVRLPVTASQGGAFIGTMYDDKIRRGAANTTSTSTSVVIVTETAEAAEEETVHIYTTMSNMPWMMTSSPRLSIKPSAKPTSAPGKASITYNVNDQIGPGINNVPLKSIKGVGQDGKKVKYPNMKGSSLCKKAKNCLVIDKLGTRSCLEEVQNRIHELAAKHPEMTFKALERIACGPSQDSTYCAYIEIVPWQPKNSQQENMFNKMNMEPYRDMQYNEVPMGAIREGIDWLRQGKAKLCGETLLPVPGPKRGGKKMEGQVYVLKVDINTTLPAMDAKLAAMGRGQ